MTTPTSQLENQLNWSRRQTAFAWGKFYEVQRQRFETNLITVNNFEANELIDEIPLGLNKHLQDMIKELYKEAKSICDCSICLDRIDSEDLKTGKCGHNFHQSCIDTWIAGGNKKCPVCRKQF